jgi:hypothetical protein
MNDVVDDHAKSDPTTDASRSFMKESPQAMPPFENAAAAFAAGAPFLDRPSNYIRRNRSSLKRWEKFWRPRSITFASRFITFC